MITDPLVISEEEELALNDRTPNAAAELIVVVWALTHLGIFKVIPRVPILIAVVFIGRSVELIRSRLADLNYDQSAGFAVLR